MCNHTPPWGYHIPPLEVNLLERVYIGASKTFGYCCGGLTTSIGDKTHFYSTLRSQ
ncbi:DUF1392 family protein [Scytonema sp. PCC 10023]|uniref:DUF1392 family protein n=1 Tax=Scytonema sp. PCC 10023 TaxID=1680591 RepID=UPI0039C639F9